MSRQRYSSADLDARLKFILGLILGLILLFTAVGILYALIFVTQPMSQSPNDAKFFELITPIATFLTGILSGIMLGKNDDKKQEEPKRDEPLELSPQDLVPEPSADAAEVAPLVVAGAVGAVAVAAADDDEDQIA